MVPPIFIPSLTAAATDDQSSRGSVLEVRVGSMVQQEAYSLTSSLSGPYTDPTWYYMAMDVDIGIPWGGASEGVWGFT